MVSGALLMRPPGSKCVEDFEDFLNMPFSAPPPNRFSSKGSCLGEEYAKGFIQLFFASIQIFCSRLITAQGTFVTPFLRDSFLNVQPDVFWTGVFFVQEQGLGDRVTTTGYRQFFWEKDFLDPNSSPPDSPPPIVPPTLGLWIKGRNSPPGSLKESCAQHKDALSQAYQTLCTRIFQNDTIEYDAIATFVIGFLIKKINWSFSRTYLRSLRLDTSYIENKREIINQDMNPKINILFSRNNTCLRDVSSGLESHRQPGQGQCWDLFRPGPLRNIFIVIY